MTKNKISVVFNFLRINLHVPRYCMYEKQYTGKDFRIKFGHRCFKWAFYFDFNIMKHMKPQHF